MTLKDPTIRLRLLWVVCHIGIAFAVYDLVANGPWADRPLGNATGVLAFYLAPVLISFLTTWMVRLAAAVNLDERRASSVAPFRLAAWAPSFGLVMVDFEDGSRALSMLGPNTWEALRAYCEREQVDVS